MDASKTSKNQVTSSPYMLEKFACALILEIFI